MVCFLIEVHDHVAVTEMVEEEQEVSDNEPEQAPASTTATPSAPHPSALKPKAKQSSIMGFFGKKPA